MIVAHRLAVAADWPFVHDAWLESFKTSHAAGPIPMDMYRTVYREVLRRLVERPRCGTWVAYNSEDHDQVFGFITFETTNDRGHVIHYVFVKNFCRRMGIATGLLRATGIEPEDPFLYTFKTPAATKLAQKWTGMRFDPLVARFPPRSTT